MPDFSFDSDPVGDSNVVVWLFALGCFGLGVILTTATFWFVGWL